MAGYFHEVHARFGTEFWVNNPSLPEINLGLDNGAVGIASNPRYVATLLKSEPDFVHKIIDEVLGKKHKNDNQHLAMQVIQKVVSRPLRMFQTRYRESRGRYGHVAIQGNPYTNDDLALLLREAETFHELGENIIIKLPATATGVQALEELTARGWSTIATMSFSVPQYVCMAEAHRRGLERTKQRPRCLITILPGMFDEYLAEDAARRGVNISSDVLGQAGLTAARAAYNIYRQRKYEAIIISGGARSPYHWTELAGGAMAITLSGKLARTLLADSPPVVSRVQASAPGEVVEELREKFPDFIRACDENSMVSEEFRSYGPVVRFQNSLTEGIDTIVKEIQLRRER
jgi:transaldolase